jgi:hypothetical protein
MLTGVKSVYRTAPRFNASGRAERRGFWFILHNVSCKAFFRLPQIPCKLNKQKQFIVHKFIIWFKKTKSGGCSCNKERLRPGEKPLEGAKSDRMHGMRGLYSPQQNSGVDENGCR